MAVSSACKTWCWLAECQARISEILNRLGVCDNTLSAGEQKARLVRVLGGPSARLDLPAVRLPRAGVEYRLNYFSVAHGARRVSHKRRKLVMKFVMFTIEGGPDHGKKAE